MTGEGRKKRRRIERLVMLLVNTKHVSSDAREREREKENGFHSRKVLSVLVKFLPDKYHYVCLYTDI